MQVHLAVLLLFDNDHSDLFKALFSSPCSWITLTAPRMYEREQQQKNGSVIYWKDVCCFVHCAVLRLTLNLKILILLKKRIWWFSWSGFIYDPYCSLLQNVYWMAASFIGVPPHFHTIYRVLSNSMFFIVRLLLVECYEYFETQIYLYLLRIIWIQHIRYNCLQSYQLHCRIEGILCYGLVYTWWRDLSALIAEIN